MPARSERFIGLVTIGLLALGGAVVASPGQAGEIEAVCRPNYDAVLSFPLSGTVEAVLVRVGQRVKKGQVLARLDDKAERQRLLQLKAEAYSDTKIKAAQAQLAQKEVDYKRIADCKKRGAATATEVEHARLDVLIKKLSLELARFDQQQAQREYQQMFHQVERMKLTAPCDGIVEKRMVEIGQSVEEGTEVLRLVNIDPHWIDAAVPLAQAGDLRLGQAAAVRYPGGRRDEVVVGKVVHVAAVADSASETRTVRVEVPNSSARPAGTTVWVGFKADKLAGKERK